MIVELLEKGIEANHARRESESPRNYKATHPSALFGCMRLQWYEQKDYDLEPHSTRSKSIFRDGHTFHQITQQDMIDLGYSKPEWTEIFVEGVCGIEGHADQILEINGELVLVDYKSSGSDEDWFGNKSWKELTKNPPLTYRMQIILYMGELRKKGYPIERGFIVFKRKCNGELAEYEIKWDEMLYEMALERTRQLWELNKNNILPEREYEDKNKFPCKNCAARKICWEKEW